MPFKEKLKLLGDSVACFNIQFAVGPKMPNTHDDVVLIQAMFNYIVHAHHDGDTLGITSPDELARMNGRCDKTTQDLINNYQRRWKRLLLEVDGRIDPAKYGSACGMRDLQISGTMPRMTITLLHQHCQDAAARLNEADYTEHMMVVFPWLRFVVQEHVGCWI